MINQDFGRTETLFVFLEKVHSEKMKYRFVFGIKKLRNTNTKNRNQEYFEF